MACVLEKTLHLPSMPGQLQVASNGLFLAAPVTKTTIGVWDFSDISSQPLELIGHHRVITCLSLSNSLLLCSAADDYIIIWNLQKCIECHLKGETVRGTVIGSQLGPVQHMAFGLDDTMVAVCSDSLIYVLNVQEEKLHMTLEGHIGQVTCVQFSPHDTSILVSAGDDRTFKVWNVSDQCLLYQSSIISSSPFLSLSIDPLQAHIALGTADGMVWFFDMSAKYRYRYHHIRHVDLAELVHKWKRKNSDASNHSVETEAGIKVSSLPSWQHHEGNHDNDNVCESDLREESLCEAGMSVLDLCYVLPNSVRAERSKWSQPSKLPFLVEEKGLVSELLETTPLIVLITTAAILIVNARTLEISSVIDLQEPVAVHDDITRDEAVISLAGSAVLSPVADHSRAEVWCLIGSLLHKELHILRLECNPKPSLAVNQKLQQCHLSDKNETTEPSSNVQLSVLSSVPLLESSPLKAEMVRKSKSEVPQKKSHANGRQRSFGQLDKQGHIVDKQPVVFHSKIKSSGYTTQPRQTMFQPQTKTKKHTLSTVKKSSENSSVSSDKSYPLLSPPPTKLIARIEIADKPTAITYVQFSGSGQSIACGTASHSAHLLRLPITVEKSKSFTGHNSKVNSVRWSHDNKWLLTASDDRTASVWSPGATEPVMTFSNIKDNLSNERDTPKKGTKDGGCFKHEIKHAQFYYMDKFIVLVESNKFHLYKYSLDPTKSDVKRYVNKSKYKLVESFSVGQSHNITATSAINSFYSYLVMCACSNRSLEVFDLNAGKSRLTLSDIHVKPGHVICQNEGSSYATLTSDAYDLFVTAAVTDCIKLWDLRSASCVRRYEGHHNRSYPCSLAISPCGRYIGTGSEDKSAYIYDLRAASYLHKLSGHSDTVSCVAFSPSLPQMVTSTLDGKLSVFTDI